MSIVSRSRDIHYVAVSQLWLVVPEAAARWVESITLHAPIINSTVDSHKGFTNRAPAQGLPRGVTRHAHRATCGSDEGVAVYKACRVLR